MMLRMVGVCAILAITTACDNRSASTAQSSTPLGPSTMSTLSATGGSASMRVMQGHDAVRVNMFDACDPATFNAVLGDGTCARAGGMPFDQFIATLTRLGFVGAWHFAPNTANIQVGSTFMALNQGGETHTFTEVAQFGGGIVPSLNELSHETTVAPECAALEPDDFVRPGGTYTEHVDQTGTAKFQCCIHPWMRLEAQVAAK